MKPTPVVGQKLYRCPRPPLYSLNIGNRARDVQEVLTPVIVRKVGRKYFSCSPEGRVGKWEETEYFLDTWARHTGYSAGSKLYSNEQEWLRMLDLAVAVRAKDCEQRRESVRTWDWLEIARRSMEHVEKVWRQKQGVTV